MDARKERIGEHAAEHAPGWAVRALGPVDRADLRGLPDGSLLHMRGTYAAETAWAPRHVGRELQRIRVSADDANLAAIRAQAEEHIARERGQQERAGRHSVLARSCAAMEAFYRTQETELELTMEARRDWEHATEQARHLAIAADSELRRRHPGQRFEPLRSDEPVVTDDERHQLALTLGAESYKTPGWITRLAGERRAVRERLDQRKGVRVPSQDRDYEDQGEARPVWTERDRDAILQPPKPQMQPAPAIAQRAAQAYPEREAAG
jgi:hypothetical protein